MGMKLRIGFGILLGLAVLAATGWYLSGHNVAIFASAGSIAHQQRQLIIISLLLSVIVVVPVFVMLGVILWKYRAHKNAAYNPDFDRSKLIESIWWGVPTLLIVILSVIAWRSSHALDPFKPLESAEKPITIQVVALQWKWLFIYPEERIATVNYVKFPEKTPVNFTITADAPMNSFWIPQLGGQVYAMSGMSTKLHLIADKPGTYNGSSANISGKGFAGMKFTATSQTRADFEKWVQQAQQNSNILTHENYDQLATPTENVPPTTYASSPHGLYDTIVMKYMRPTQ